MQWPPMTLVRPRADSPDISAAFFAAGRQRLTIIILFDITDAYAYRATLALSFKMIFDARCRVPAISACY